MNIFNYHPYGWYFRFLKYFGFWRCDYCNKLHTSLTKIYYIADNDWVCNKCN